MHFFFVLLFIMSSNKIIEVRFCEVPPKIDGVIEEIWETADSVYDFVQFSPFEQDIPSENTIAYILQDDHNLYFAFRCYALNHKPIACLGGNEDYITLYIDSFNSKTTAYYFKVCASGTYHDGWILDDGRSSDDSWDSVWHRAAKVYDNRYEIEIKIPFKSIRYKKGLSKWGINFKRHIAMNQETSYWTEVSQIEGNIVSKYGILRELDPQTTGYYFELYPEGFIRYDKIIDEQGEFKPSVSLNLRWDITSQTTLSATALPDFAQIESDPFTLNLSRYPIYLSERRPFFLEGKDIFRMSDFGEGKGFFSPLNIFYSRMIGKSLNEKPVSIIGGLKVTSKSTNWNLGVLGAYTDSLDTEPTRGFGILRIKKSIFKNSDIGMLFSGTVANKNDHNFAIGIDGVYRSGVNQLIIQSAISDKNEKIGWAISSGYFGFIQSWLTMGGIEVVQDSFDVSDIGYVPWNGMKRIMLFSGPFKQYPEGVLQSLFIAPGIAAIQEPGNTRNWSILGFFVVNPTFRSSWGFNVELQAGRYYEADTNYFSRGVNVSIWTSKVKYNINLGGNYRYGYNYNRGFLSYQASNWLWFGYNMVPRIYVSLSSNIWMEWDTLNTLLATTPVMTPRIDFKITKDMSLGLFMELVLTMPEMDIAEVDLVSNRFGALFSWNFSPKSWLYIAFNDYRIQDEEDRLQPQNRIGAVKVKYLLYF